jgi:hypothetical protein
MKNKKQIEEMARLEFGEKFSHLDKGKATLIWLFVEDEPNRRTYAGGDYLTDHNACQRVIDGLVTATAISEYRCSLINVCRRDGVLYIEHATCRQKVEAILKATGDWGEDNDKEQK